MSARCTAVRVGDPAQHPGDGGERRIVRRRPRARAARRSRACDRHRHFGRVLRHLVRRRVPRGVHPGAGPGRAVVRRPGVLLARPVRRNDVGHARRQRSAQRLADGRARPVCRQIGQEGIYAYDRFTFGIPALSGGISLIPALIGAFGFAEVLTRLADPVERKLVEMKDSILPRFRRGRALLAHRAALRRDRRGDRLMPGVGEDSGAWMSYAAAKATTREPEYSAKGSIDGLMAAETGDMSSIPGQMIPMLALGVPGSAPSAVLMAAIIIHGIQPGPMMMVEHPKFAYDMVAMTTLATVCILIFGLFLVRPLLYVLRVKHSVLMPIIFLMSVVGSYATAWRLFDVYAMLAVGVGAFFLRRKGYQMAPFVLGLVLGNLLDKSLRRGLVLTDGSIVPFFTRPICIAFAAVTIFTMLLYVPAFNRVVRRIADAVISPLKSLVGRRG